MSIKSFLDLLIIISSFIIIGLFIRWDHQEYLKRINVKEPEDVFEVLSRVLRKLLKRSKKDDK